MKKDTQFKKVVFIDDDKEFVNFYSAAMQKKGLSDYLILFNNAKEGLSYLKKAKKDELPEYILLDLYMPELDGFAFLEKIEKLEKVKNNVEIYICTSSGKKADRDKIMNFTFVSAYLQKPISSEFLEYLIKDKPT
jgi:CheY-like chemotaxis protein